MPVILQSLGREFDEFADFDWMAHIALRLLVAAALGAVLGYERERQGKNAGLRTYMLVTVSTAFFILIPQREGFDAGAMSRVIQGLVTGIGFLGGGAILKLSSDREIIGLTTAAGLWLATAIGIGVGFGRLGSSIIVTIFALIILSSLENWERRLRKK